MLTVLARSGEAAGSTGGTDTRGSAATVLCQVLHTRPSSAGGGVHSVPVLPADQAGSVTRPHAVQRKHCRTYGLLHCTRYNTSF